MTRSAIISIDQQKIFIRTPHALRGENRREFLKRVFAYPNLDGVELDRSGRKVCLHLAHKQDVSKETVLESLASLLDEKASPEASIDVRIPDQAHVFRRWKGVMTSLELYDLAPGQVSVRLSGRRQPGMDQSYLSLRMKGLPGVHEIRYRRFPGRLIVEHDPAVNPRVWIRYLETLLTGLDPVVKEPSPLPFIASNTNLALSTTSQFFFPQAIPVACAVLLVTRVPHIRATLKELSRGQVGSPFFGTVVLACSIATLSPFASALAEWLTRVWERRLQHQLSRESHLLLADLEPRGSVYSGRTPDAETRVQEGDTLPFDGRMVQGDLLVQDVFGDPLITPVIRKRAGDSVETGYRVLAGEAQLLPATENRRSRVEQVLQTVGAFPQTLPEDPILRKEGRRVADKAVLPNLALSGLAVATGGLHMASAVLHQDWSVTPTVGAPVEFFQDVRLALSRGALIRSPLAMPGLSGMRILLIDCEYPGLADARCRVSGIEAATESPPLTARWASALAGWVGDGRVSALSDYADQFSMPRIEARFLGFEGGVLHLDIEGQHVSLHDQESDGAFPDLCLTADGACPEVIRFAATEVPRYRNVLDELKSLGIAPVLMGESQDSGVSALAQRLGVEVLPAGMKGDQFERIVANLKKAGYPVGLLTNRAVDPQGAVQLEVVISPHDGPLEDSRVSVSLLGASLSVLPGLVKAARSLPGRVAQASLKTAPTNLLCILGAFTGVVNGATSTLLAHAGVFAATTHHASQSRKRKSARQPS